MKMIFYMGIQKFLFSFSTFTLYLQLNRSVVIGTKL